MSYPNVIDASMTDHEDPTVRAMAKCAAKIERHGMLDGIWRLMWRAGSGEGVGWHFAKGLASMACRCGHEETAQPTDGGSAHRQKDSVVWDISCPGFGCGSTRAVPHISYRGVAGRSQRETIGLTSAVRYPAALARAQEQQRRWTGGGPARRMTLGQTPRGLHQSAEKNNIRPRTADGYRYALNKYAADWLDSGRSPGSRPLWSSADIPRSARSTGRNGTKLTSTA